MHYLFKSPPLILKVFVLQGFSLIELLVSIVIFSSGLLSIVNLQIQAHANLSAAYYRGQAENYIATRHEIQALMVKDNFSALRLSEIWQKNIESNLPGVIVEITTANDKSIVVELMWEVSQKDTSCSSEKNKNKDCLKF